MGLGIERAPLLWVSLCLWQQFQILRHQDEGTDPSPLQSREARWLRICSQALDKEAEAHARGAGLHLHTI